MQLGLGIQPVLRTKLALQCTVCERNRDEEEVAEAATALALFGLADPYAACPSCFKEVFYPLREDAEYRRRVRVFLYQKFGRVLKEP